jgi:RimJ/RimL family protein N-acetyltransferase
VDRRAGKGCKKTMIFTTTRLKIRKALPTDEDTEMYFRLWTDGRVMVNVGFPNGLQITRDKMRQILESEGESEFNCLLVIERQSDGQCLGECKLGAPDENGIAETDVKLLPEYWGHSYGVETKRGLLDYLFSHTDCRAVRASPNVNNRPSIRMQEAVGGQRIDEGLYEFPEHMRSYTTPVHCYIYEVTRQAWEALPREGDSSSITIQIKPAGGLSPAEQKQLDDLLERVFHDDPYAGMAYAKMEWNVLVYVGNVLASNVEIVERTVTVGGQPVRVGGIGGVATLPEYRGRSLATQAMIAAAKFMEDELGLEYGLLITSTRRETFYKGLGWQVISEPAYFDQPSGKIQNEGITMSLSMAGKFWPPGMVDFCSLPW